MSTIRTEARLPLAARSEHLVGSVIDSSTSLLAAQTHDIVRLAMGSPAQDSIPAAALAEVPLEPHAFDYAATEGAPVLREALLAQLADTSDETTPDRLTITSGGMRVGRPSDRRTHAHSVKTSAIAALSQVRVMLVRRKPRAPRISSIRVVIVSSSL